jgi:hypothetical protein
MVSNAAALLPHQGILENFVHHNPLEHFQRMTFSEAIEHVHKLESYRSPAERTFAITRINPRERVKEGLVDLSAAFVDRGAAKWIPRFRNRGFLYFFAYLENLGLAPWRKQARQAASQILMQLNQKDVVPEAVAESRVPNSIHQFFSGVLPHPSCRATHVPANTAALQTADETTHNQPHAANPPTFCEPVSRR